MTNPTWKKTKCRGIKTATTRVMVDWAKAAKFNAGFGLDLNGLSLTDAGDTKHPPVGGRLFYYRLPGPV